MSLIDLCAYVGLGAVFLSTANMLVGLMIAVRYSPVRYWPHRRINIFAIHNWTAYLLLASIIIHPLILLFVSHNRFRILDVLVPVRSPVQPMENTIGAVGLYLLVIVVLTSYFKRKLGRRNWKFFHYGVYAAGVAVFVHSLLTDPHLRGDSIDYLDGGKVFVEICLLTICVASLWACRYRIRKDRREHAAQTGKYAPHEAFGVSALEVQETR